MFAEMDLLLGLIPPSENALDSEGLDTGVSALLSLSGREMVAGNSDHGPVILVLTEETEGHLPTYFDSVRRPTSRNSPRRFVRVSATIEILPEALDLTEYDSAEIECESEELALPEPYVLDATPLNWQPEEIEDEANTTAMECFGEAINTMLLCVILAAPGGFEIEAAIPSRILKLLNCDVYDTTEVSRELGWPTIRRLDAGSVHEWIIALPGWKEGFGKGQAGRALAAFAHLLHEAERGGPITLIWALVGIEALYGGRSGPLTEQILDNSELLLGPRLANKKVFARMYNFRSRFIHGDLDLPFPHRDAPVSTANDTTDDTTDDATDDSSWDWYDSYAYPMDFNEIVAIAMLLASLQELIIRGWTSFGFVKTIVGQKEST